MGRFYKLTCNEIGDGERDAGICLALPRDTGSECLGDHGLSGPREKGQGGALLRSNREKAVEGRRRNFNKRLQKRRKGQSENRIGRAAQEGDSRKG